MNEIDRRLEERELAGRPIRVGLIGAGQMGTEIIAQVGEMAGMRVAVVVDLTHERAARGFAFSRRGCPVAATDDPAEAGRAIAAGSCVATTNHRLATSLPQVDAVIEATGDPEDGALAAQHAIDARKHIVMMNVECDVTVGPLLAARAREAGVVYSLASGDEPAAIIELCRFARALGFRIVAAGKGKNNPLDVHATPEQWQRQAEQRGMSPRMLVEFVDGSKTMVEMAAVSNATGLVPDIRGMHGPRVLVKDLTRVFCTRDRGGLLEKEGVVDYAIGDVHPGVFVVVTTDNAKIRESLVQRDMGNGPEYLLYRPYHLCSLEVPLTVARAVIYGESSGHPRMRPTSECIAIAKKDLSAGETLDGIGEHCYRGSIETFEVASRERFLPLGLARGCVLRRDVERDSVIGWDMVEPPADSPLRGLRKALDARTGRDRA
jgi:predicted homoserine dehydrogenase-like protein